MKKETTVFYVTDIHGSNVCFRKFLNAGKIYNADILVIGAFYNVTRTATLPVQHLYYQPVYGYSALHQPFVKMYDLTLLSVSFTSNP